MRAWTASTADSKSECYSGPIEVRVLDPHGNPAVGAALGIFGATWYSPTGEDPPPQNRDRRTDEHGRFTMDQARECMPRSIHYAYDESRRMAGFCFITHQSDLAEPQTVKLRPARWVTGRIVSSEQERAGKRPQLVSAHLYPWVDGELAYRGLRYVPSESRRFRFLLPPGSYDLTVGGAGLESRRGVQVSVPPGEK
ncbi:MAG: carboxypeptidase regulatory-like domain-containing protein, partial [bacterium]|nr:carboxypeptidase regulatory-like domain-containing protein [bacterium]